MNGTGSPGGPAGLPEWEAFLNGIDPDAIELGLDRVMKAARALGVASFPGRPVVTVAGTNGKGSTAAMIAEALAASGVSCGLYTSPHILRFAERIRVNGAEAGDAELCEAFAAVRAAAAAAGVRLTYFEYATLAALLIFRNAGCEVLVLEVGLGGRLDAVNAVDCDVAVIPSIGLDHCAILGNTEALIAREKAGIIKPSARAVILGSLSGEADGAVRAEARARGVPASRVFGLGREIAAVFRDGPSFDMTAPYAIAGVRVPALPLVNAPLALLAAVFALRELGAAPDPDRLREGIAAARLPGRIEVVSENPEVILDVAHNPPAVKYLAAALRKRGRGERRAVVGMLRDKDIAGALRETDGLFGEVYAADLPGRRGAPAAYVKEGFVRAGMPPEKIRTFGRVADACAAALRDLPDDAGLVVFGSFVTVAEALRSGLFRRGG